MNDNDIKDLENKSVSEAIDYYRREPLISRRIQILKNMSVEQIVSLIKNENNARVLLTQLDDNKLLNVVNNLGEDGIEIVFKKPLNERTDSFTTIRNTLIERIKYKGLTESTISFFKKLGYNDFDNIAHFSSNQNVNSNQTQTTSQINQQTSNTQNGNLMGIEDAKSEIKKLEQSFKDFSNYLETSDISELCLNELKNINKKFDKYLKIVEDLKDKLSIKPEIESRIKEVNEELNKVYQKYKEVSNNIRKLETEKTNAKDNNEKSIKDQEISKLNKEKDDLTDLINYLFQGDKYFTGTVFKGKNKPIPAIIQNMKNKKQLQNNQQSVPSTPKIIPNSIKYYIKKGKLPNNLTENEYVELAKSLSIPAADTNYVLNNNELNRLLTSKKIMMASINKKVKKNHKDLVTEYDNLIKQYEKILADMNIYSASEKERKIIEDTIKNLNNLKSKYNTKINNLGFDNSKDYINFDDKKSKKQNSQNKRIEKISNDINKNDELLREKYNLINTLEREKAKNPKFKDKFDKRIEILNKQIKELQKKQIQLNKTQTMIINKNNEKYIEKVKEKQQRYKDEQRLANAHAEKMINIEHKKSQFEEEKERLKNSLNAMSSSDKKQKRQAKRDIAKLNRKIISLNLKTGYCSLEHQVCQGVAVSGYTK